MDVVCLGELLLDMFPAEMGIGLAEQPAWFPKPGGAPANVAVAAARLDCASAFIGEVGDEAFGHYLVDVLRQNNVDVSGVRFATQAKTTLAFHAKPDPNTAEFLFYRDPGADMLLQSDELERGLIRNCRVLHFGSITLIQEPSRSATYDAVALARQARAMVSFDVNYRPSLWPSRQAARARMLETLSYVNLLKVNEVEIELLADATNVEAAADALLHLGPELVVVTLGPNGSYYRTAEQRAFVPAFQVETVDAVGCGDGFVAGLLSRLIQARADWRHQLTAESLTGHLRYANAVGALTALKPGVIPALPTKQEVDRFLEQRG